MLPRIFAFINSLQTAEVSKYHDVLTIPAADKLLLLLYFNYLALINLEYVPGRDLLDRLSQRKSLPSASCCQFSPQHKLDRKNTIVQEEGANSAL